MTNAQFRAWRKQMGYTQEQAAEALGMSRRYIQRCERDAEIVLVVELATQALWGKKLCEAAVKLWSQETANV